MSLTPARAGGAGRPAAALAAGWLIATLSGCAATGAGEEPAVALQGASRAASLVDAAAPSPAVVPRAAASRAPSSAPARAAGDTLLLVRDGAVYSMSLRDPAGELTYLASGPDQVVVDPTGRFVASTDENGATFVRLADGRVAARSPGASAVAFSSDGRTAITARYLRPAAGEEDCDRPTVLERVDLQTGIGVPVHADTRQLVPVAASAGSVLLSAPSDDCSTLTAVLLDTQTGRLTTLGPEGMAVTANAALDRIWMQRSADADHDSPWAQVYDESGRVVATTGLAGTAAYGPDNALAYTQLHFGPKGTPEEFLPQRGVLRLATAQPDRSDVSKPFPSEGNLVWDVNGRGIAMRRALESDPMQLRAWYCTVPALSCRALPLVWSDEVELLAVVPASHVGG